METKQPIFLERRNYNRWVNNQTLEDYALRFTAKSARKWSLSRVANTALGAISFLALEAIGAAVTLNYGFDNALAATLVVSTLIFLAGLPICYYAAKYGVDIDLLTRGAGFGYLGSTVTSLIYASFTFIFFALEAAIMAKALELLTGLPLAYGYLISALVVIPLVFYGVTFISRFQLWTQPLWISLQLLPFIFILLNGSSLIPEWQSYQGSKQSHPGVNLLLFGAASSVMFALLAQTGEQVDYLRFLPQKNKHNRLRWWCALVGAGPGWVIVGAIKILAGSFLAVVAVKHGVALADASDPTTMYSVAFGFVTDNAHLALVIAAIFVIVSQLKINVTNAYAGSIAWSNFFSRLTHSHPGRVVWLVFNVTIALLLMELGIYHTFENTLSIYAIVAVSWVGALVADLVLNKPLKLSPSHIEFKRAHLYDINPVGMGAMFAASVLGILSYFGLFGDYGQALAHFIALGSSFVIAPLIAYATKGKYYIARQPLAINDDSPIIACSVCENTYESEDIAFCPAYDGHICSLCCSLNSRCQDSCKTNEKTLSQRLISQIKKILPDYIVDYVTLRLLNFTALLVLISTITGILLALIYNNDLTDNEHINSLLASTLWKVFFILMIVAGVISWLFVLARESQFAAQKESSNQTLRLIEEIEAHEKTDTQLQLAKEHAEAANNAKSRYLTGISHELRTPLNTVMGYAQLMEIDQNIPLKTREKASIIRRSSEHLADLIEGLLDISKIEAGRLDIRRDRIQFQPLMQQLVDMFRIQAEEKGLYFNYECDSKLPDIVIGDEKRLRQIIINLLSNAIKFTTKGGVALSLRYRNQVAEFKVSDSGIGIPENELSRIFEPFERVRHPGSPMVAGTGLGLTITRLLTDIMGGDLVVENNKDSGVTFTVSLMLSSVITPIKQELKSKPIYSYHGARKSVFIVDDDPSHRGLISDLLTPIGFAVVEAPDAETCLSMVDDFAPDIFLIDRLMPGIDGPKLAELLRKKGFNQPILIVSATGSEDMLSHDKNPSYDGYVIKPIKLNALLEMIAIHLEIDWSYSADKTDHHTAHIGTFPQTDVPNAKLSQKIIDYAEIGNLGQLKMIAEKIESESSASPLFVEQLNRYIKEIKFNKIIELLKTQANDS